MSLKEALREYAMIVEETRQEYTQEELTVAVIRAEHPELDFMDDDEIQEIINFANRGRGPEREYTLKELSRRADLRTRRMDLLRETLCLTARGLKEDYEQADKLDKEIEKITAELESM